MKRVNILLLALLVATGLFAEFTGTPQIMMIEVLNDASSTQTQDVNDGIGVIDESYSPANFSLAQHYHGDMGNDDTQAMIDFYQVIDFPMAIFDGSTTIFGGGDHVANGSAYAGVIDLGKYNTAPIELQIDGFDASSGDVAATVTMLSDEFEIMDGYVRFILVEDGIDGIDHVTRQVLTQDFSMTGQGSQQTLIDGFTIDSGWVSTNLQVVVYVQASDHSIIQSASTYPMDEVTCRVGVPFDFNVVGPGYTGEVYEFTSEKFYLKNYGSEHAYSASLEYNSVPDSWMVMFCHTYADGEGGCHPSTGGAWEFTLGEGEQIAFDFLIPNVSSNGTADFNFTIQPSHSEAIVLNFTYETGSAAGDDTVPYSGVQLAQNTPNPFNPETQIHFSLPTDNVRNTKLSIYNVRGQLVKSFDNLSVNQGKGSVSWNGKDSYGNPVTSGVYYYRLEGEQSSAAKKMLLLK